MKNAVHLVSFKPFNFLVNAVTICISSKCFSYSFVYWKSYSNGNFFVGVSLNMADTHTMPHTDEKANTHFVIFNLYRLFFSNDKRFSVSMNGRLLSVCNVNTIANEIEYN